MLRLCLLEWETMFHYPIDRGCWLFVHGFYTVFTLILQFLLVFLTTWYVIFNTWINVAFLIIITKYILKIFFNGKKLGLCLTDRYLTGWHICLLVFVYVVYLNKRSSVFETLCMSASMFTCVGRSNCKLQTSRFAVNMAE